MISCLFDNWYCGVIYAISLKDMLPILFRDKLNESSVIKLKWKEEMMPNLKSFLIWFQLLGSTVLVWPQVIHLHRISNRDPVTTPDSRQVIEMATTNSVKLLMVYQMLTLISIWGHLMLISHPISGPQKLHVYLLGRPLVRQLLKLRIILKMKYVHFVGEKNFIWILTRAVIFRCLVD